MSGQVVVLGGIAFFAILFGFLIRRQKKVATWHWALMIVGPLLVLVTFGVAEVSSRSKALAPFRPYIDEYLRLPGEKAGQPILQMAFAHPTGDPYIRGKALPVHLRNKAPDSLYFRLPAELRPAGPDEVSTVIWVDCTSNTRVIRRVGGSTRNTVEYTCNVAIIDRSVPAIVAMQSFNKTSGEQGYEEVLYPTIAKYLADLPRKEP